MTELTNIVFFQHIKLKKRKHTPRIKGTKKEQFEQRVVRIKNIAKKVNEKL